MPYLDLAVRRKGHNVDKRIIVTYVVFLQHMLYLLFLAVLCLVACIPFVY